MHSNGSRQTRSNAIADWGPFDFRVANISDVGEARHLQDAVFGSEYGVVPRDGLDDDATHFVATVKGKGVIATCRLLGPGLRPFEFEHVLDLTKVVSAGRRPALLGRLCLLPEFRRARLSLAINAGLFDIVRSFALSSGITDLYLFTHRRLMNFYAQAGFTDTEVAFEHADWGHVRIMICTVGSPLRTSPASGI